MLHRLGHGRLGDGVEHHPLHRGALKRLLAIEHLEHVPGDGLALAVRVGGQDQAIGALHGVGDVVEPLRRLGVHFPAHGEVFVGFHRTVLRRQVPHVSVARKHLEVGPKVFVDGFDLAGTFDDDDVHSGRCNLLGGVLGAVSGDGWTALSTALKAQTTTEGRVFNDCCRQPGPAAAAAPPGPNSARPARDNSIRAP